MFILFSDPLTLTLCGNVFSTRWKFIKRFCNVAFEKFGNSTFPKITWLPLTFVIIEWCVSLQWVSCLLAANINVLLQIIMSTRGIADPCLDPLLASASADSSRSQSPLVTAYKFRPLCLKVQDRYESKDPFFSFEFFPPRTANGALNLLAR